MCNDQAVIDALNQTIKTQQELLNYLKSEIERLKTATFYIPPQPNQGAGGASGPLWPNMQPFIGTPLPPGHQQWPYSVETTSNLPSSIGTVTLNGGVTTTGTATMCPSVWTTDHILGENLNAHESDKARFARMDKNDAGL